MGHPVEAIETRIYEPNTKQWSKEHKYKLNGAIDLEKI